ncbi:MAG: VWA-like domain-containing protein [Acidimicrobiales bacterium]
MSDIPLDAAKVAAGRLFAASKYPYLASALFAAPVLAAPGSGTIAVDRHWRVLADPGVVEGVGAQELGRLLVHLVSHLLRDHAARAVTVGVGDDGAGVGDRPTAVAWARSADAELNDDLEPQAMVPASAPDLPGALGGLPGGLAEQYYELRPPGPRFWDCGSGCDGVPRPWDPEHCHGGHARPCTSVCLGTGERQAQWLRLATASELQRWMGLEPGRIPAGWARWAEKVLPSKVDWRRALAAEVRWGVQRAAGMVDYSYRKPSRRAEAAPGIIFPVLQQPVPDVAVVCDTSGSMTEGQLGRALAEVEALLQRAGLRDRQVRVLVCDVDVKSVRRVSRASQVELVGGGGTDMAMGIAHALALRPRPSVVVVLTDGWTPWPADPVRGARVIVALIGPTGGTAHRLLDREPPPPPSWARTVRVEVPA